jgi:hypothetical protein
MQQKEGFKKFLPHLLAIGIFIVFSCAFCYPAFQGNTIYQHDMNTWLEGSKESRDYYEKTGQNALWANNMFSGMPQNMIDFYPENNWYNKINHLVQFYSHGKVPNPATYFLIAMLSFYILMHALRANRWLGIIGAIAFAFSSYNPIIISAGHTTKMLDIAFLPAILAGIIHAYRGKYLMGGALAGFAMALFFDTGHWQIIYYGALLIAALGIAALVDAIRKGAVKRWIIASVVLLLAAGFAMATNSTRLLLGQEYSPYSMRGGKSELTENKKANPGGGLDKEYAFRWSVGLSESLCILVPDLYGGSTGENIGEDSHFGQKLAQVGAAPQQVSQMTERAFLYWGAQQDTGNLSGPVYFGAVICLLFVLSLMVIRSKHKWWVAGMAFLFMVFAMGRNFAGFNYFMFDHFPGYNKFRTPSMALAISSILFPVLAIWALKDIFEEKISKEELWKKLKISLIITGGLCLLILIATQTAMDYKGAIDDQIQQSYGQVGPELMKALREDRSAAASSDALRSLIFVLLAGGLLWAYAKNKLKKEMAIASLGLLIAIDEIPVAHRYLNERNFLNTETYEMQFQPTQSDVQILQDKDPYYRVLDLSNSGGPFNDSRPSYFHKSIGGYHGAKMQIYQELIENQIGKYNAAVLNMLNTKYIVMPGEKGGAIPQRNPGALGNAWFVSDIKWVKNADEEMKALDAPSLRDPMDTSAGNFNPLSTIILRDTFKSIVGNYTFGKDSSAYVRLAPDGYGPRNLKFQSENSSDGLAVFSDIYYPIGWKATIDGKEVPILRANYVLRALKIPAGKHVIEFSYDSPAFEKGEKFALIGSILLTLLILGGIYVSCFRKEKQEPAAAGAGPSSGNKK